MTSKQATIGLVASQRQAERILTALEGAGLSRDDVSVLSPGVPQGDGTTALRVAPSAVVIPGAGSFVAAGPILVALSGELVGGGSRSIGATLIRMGIREREAEHYEDRVLEGRVLVCVHVDDHEGRALAKAILLEGRATSILAVAEPSASGREASDTIS